MYVWSVERSLEKTSLYSFHLEFKKKKRGFSNPAGQRKNRRKITKRGAKLRQEVPISAAGEVTALVGHLMVPSLL